MHICVSAAVLVFVFCICISHRVVRTQELGVPLIHLKLDLKDPDGIVRSHAFEVSEDKFKILLSGMNIVIILSVVMFVHDSSTKKRIRRMKTI